MDDKYKLVRNLEFDKRLDGKLNTVDTLSSARNETEAYIKFTLTPEVAGYVGISNLFTYIYRDGYYLKLLPSGEVRLGSGLNDSNGHLFWNQSNFDPDTKINNTDPRLSDARPARGGAADTAASISNPGNFTLASAEKSDAITVTEAQTGNRGPTKLIDFHWYNTKWSIGNIRGGSTDSVGFGLYFNGVEKYLFPENGRLQSTAGVFALTSEIPTSLPANGGRSETTMALDIRSDRADYGSGLVMYQGSSYSDSPADGQWFSYLRMLHNNSSGYFNELAFNLSGQDNHPWVRRLVNGVLSGWERLAFVSDIPTINIVDKAFIISSLNQAGEVTMTQHWVFAGGVANTASDIRFKRNIEPIEGVLGKINNLSVFKYNWEYEDGKLGERMISISAQELEEKFPEATYTANDERQTKTVDMQAEIAILFQAVKELNNKIQILEDENKALKNRLNYE